MISSKIILASASPRRRELFSQVNIPVTIQASLDSEPEPLMNEDPIQFAQRSSLAKALSVQKTQEDPNIWIVAADTIVQKGQEILEKPNSVQAAIKMLTQLSGKEHQVITAFTILHKETQIQHLEAETTRVWFRQLSKQQIHRYVDSGEPMDKAGAYGIQGQAAKFVERIQGCYFNVVGLPIGLVLARLREFGWTEDIQG